MLLKVNVVNSLAIYSSSFLSTCYSYSFILIVYVIFFAWFLFSGVPARHKDYAYPKKARQRAGPRFVCEGKLILLVCYHFVSNLYAILFVLLIILLPFFVLALVFDCGCYFGV